MMRHVAAPARWVAAATVCLVALTGCGFKGAYSLPLPGGAAKGKTIHLTAEFKDVQDLVPENAVRVNDVAVGDVTDIKVGRDDHNQLIAVVSMKVKQSAAASLPANTVATLQQTTLLGEKYIALSAPTDGSVGQLADGAKISDADTDNLPDVEEVFGVLSQVLNGGSLGDLQTINIEVDKALAGRESQVRGALKQLNTFVGGLDHQKREIVRALDELNRFSGALAGQTQTIGDALDNLSPGLNVLADEQSQFTHLLTDLSKFGRVATHIITASRKETVAGLRDLKPILGHLAAAGSNLPHALEILVTFPFPKGFVRATPGDYSGLRLTFNGDPVLLASVCPIVKLPTCPKMTTSNSPTSNLGTSKHHTKSKTTHKHKTTVPKVVLPTPLQSPGQLLGGVIGGLTGGDSL